MPDMPTKLTYNMTTGETTIEPLTQEEIDRLSAAEAEASAQRLAAEEVHSSALSKLADLGLTEEEISSLLRGN